MARRGWGRVLYILNNFRDEFQLLGMLAVLGAALRWGAGPERGCAFAYAILFVYDPIKLVSGIPNTFYQSIDVAYVLIDIVVAVGFLLIALWSNRLYPLCLTAFQLMALASHLIRDVSSQISAMAYFVLAAGPSYLQLFTIAGGIWFHHRREARFGPYRSWRISSRLLQAIDPKGYPKG